jgi:branched-subunit amino acid transport protein AzlD
VPHGHADEGRFHAFACSEKGVDSGHPVMTRAVADIGRYLARVRIFWVGSQSRDFGNFIRFSETVLPLRILAFLMLFLT